MHSSTILPRARAIASAAFVATLAWAPAAFAGFQTLHTFTDTPDGRGPIGGLQKDANGALYGTTVLGGAQGSGMVFKLEPKASRKGAWKEVDLYDRTFAIDGNEPSPFLLLADGTLVGTSGQAGDSGTGRAFSLAPPPSGGTPWIDTPIVDFGAKAPSAADPIGGLLADGGGGYFGVSRNGGSGDGNFGCGTVFRISAPPASTLTTLHAFDCTDEGDSPVDRLVADAAGNLYGTTSDGYDGGASALFRLSPPVTPSKSWSITVLWHFDFDDVGLQPLTGVTLMPDGSLVGTTSVGGAFFAGTVYRLAPPAQGAGRDAPWRMSVLHAFTGGADGGSPSGALSLDAQGRLVGTANVGGTQGFGTVFRMTPKAHGKWSFKVLHAFNGSTDGAYPSGALFVDDAGIYGAAGGGSQGSGTIYRITP